MKKILASLLVLVMVFSCVGVALVSVSAEEEVNVFWLTHYNDHFVEGAGVVFTAEDSDSEQAKDDYKVSDNKLDGEGKSAPAYTGWWLHVSFKPVEGFKTVYEVVEISNGLADGHATILAIPQGGFVYAVNTGNNWPQLYKDHPDQYAGNANDPDYTNPGVNTMISAMGNWKVGDRFVINGLDLAGLELPTTTPDKAWYEKTADGKESTYICTATYAKFDPNNPPKENDPSEPTEVVETVKVDGVLDDTGYNKATWVNDVLWQQSNAPTIENASGKFTSRTDDENVYVAVELKGLPAPNALADYAPDLTPNEAGTQIAGYGQTSASMLRVWIRNNESYRYGIDIQYLGEEKGWTVVRLIYDDPAISVKLADFKPEYKIGYADGTLTAEISFKKADFKVTGDYSLYVTYSTNLDKVDDKEATYQAIHIVNPDAEKTDAGYITNYSGNTNLSPYFKFAAKDAKLGTYTEGQDPTVAYREEMAEKVGEPLTDPSFTVDLQSTIAQNDAGKIIMTVVMTIKDIKEGVSFHGLDLIFHYDNSRMRLVTPLKTDAEGEADVLDCATKLPYDSWENLTQEVFDEEGKTTGDVEVRFVTATPEHALDASHTLELTFTFEMKLLNTYGGAYVPTGSISALYVPNDNSSTTTTYYGNGSSTVASTTISDDSSSSSESTDSTSQSGKPGDAGILVFAVMGILALAGAVTVIKVRR